MNIVEILNSFFILPAIKAGIREQVWQTPIHDNLKPIREIWYGLDLLDHEGKLSEKGQQLYDIHPMIDYFMSLWDDYKFYSPHETYKISDEQYDLLREGLELYSRYNLSNCFQYCGLTGKQINVLDYGGGNGGLLIDFIKYNPSSKGILVDRKKANNEEFGEEIVSHAIDFEINPLWHTQYEDRFDMIILSEVLHCKNKKGRQYLIDSSHCMLKPGGILFIIEVKTNPFFDWRMKMYTEGGKSLEPDEIKDQMDSSSWKEVKLVPYGDNHYINIYKTKGEISE